MALDSLLGYRVYTSNCNIRIIDKEMIKMNQIKDPTCEGVKIYRRSEEAQIQNFRRRHSNDQY